MKKRKVLIVHPHFPGQFRHVAAMLASRSDVELKCCGGSMAQGLRGVPVERFAVQQPVVRSTQPSLRQMEQCMQRGQALARELRQFSARGFEPDVILAHPGWGEMMYARDLFPRARLVHLCEWYHSAAAGETEFDPEYPLDTDTRLRARTFNALHALNLELCDLGITPTHWQRSRHPQAYWPKIKVVHEGVDAELYRPDAQASCRLPDGAILHAGEPVITFVARALEPARGIHVFLRALEHLQKRHKGCQAVIVGGEASAPGRPASEATRWRERLLSELSLDRSRIHFTGWLGNENCRRVLQVSALHVHLSYPFLPSQSMLEAMASGCLLLASDTPPVREYVDDGESGMLVDFHHPLALAERALEALCTAPDDTAAMRAAARRAVQQRCNIETGVRRYLELMGLEREVACEIAA